MSTQTQHTCEGAISLYAGSNAYTLAIRLMCKLAGRGHSVSLRPMGQYKKHAVQHRCMTEGRVAAISS